MADFAVVEGEMVPIDVSGNPLPIAEAAAVGTTPSIIVGGKEGSTFRSLQLRTVTPGKGLIVSPFNESNTSLYVQPADYYNTEFGEFRVANPYTLADLNFRYEIDPREFGTSTATGGTVTYVSASATARLAVTASSGSRARLRTHTFFRYQSGKTLAAAMTLYHDNAGLANQTRRWGIYDDNDGLFFRLTSTTLDLVRRSSTSGAPVDTPIARASWNGDKLDGTGPSGITLNLTFANIYEIHYQWLGAGTVSFFINGILVHKLRNANTLSVPYMRTGQLPIQWEVVNTGASVIAGINAICCSAKVLGGDDPPQYTFGARNVADITVPATERPILSIRPRLTYPAAIENRMLVLPKIATVKTEGSRAGWSIILNATLTGFSWNNVNANSGVEFDVASTSFTGGEVIYNGFLPNNNAGGEVYLSDIFTVLGRKLRRDAFAATTDTLTITGYNEAAGTTNMRASISWGEVRLCLLT
jgi:hypothetical protein